MVRSTGPGATARCPFATPMKSSQMNGLVLAVAAAAGVVGLLLKVTEFGDPRSGSPPGSPPQASAPVDARAQRGTLSETAIPRSEEPTPPAAELLARADAGTDLPVTNAPGRTREGAGSGPEVGVWKGTAGVKVRPPDLHPAPAHARPHGRPRTGSGAASGSSVQVASAGTDGAATLGGARLGMAPAGAPGQAVAAPEPGKTPGPDDAPQVPPDVAYDSGDAVLFSTDSPVEVPELGKIAGRSGTVSLWLQPQWADGSHDDAAIVQLGDSLQLVKNVNFLRFELPQENGAGGIGVPITDWKQGEWHQVTATWNGSQLSLYVDGQLASTTTGVNPIDLPKDTRLLIGSDFPASRPVAPAVIGRVDLRNRPLGPSEIARAYNRTANDVLNHATHQ